MPLSVAQTYTHYLPCGDQRGREAAERERTRDFHAAGLAVTTYFNPMICTGYEPRYAQAVARGALNTDAAGAPYTYRYTGSTVFAVSQFDFTAPAGRDLYRRLLGEASAAGYDGWMEDFGEYTPLDARARAGPTGSALHNRYPRDYHCAAYAFARRAPRPLVRFQRSGWTGAARCAQVVWGGDPTTGWGFDGLRSALYQGLTMGLSGVSRWGSDIGGYFSLQRQPAHPRAADPLDPARRGVGRDAYRGQRARGAGQATAADLRPRGTAPVAPLGQAAHAALPLSRGRRRPVPAHGNAASCASSGSSTRTIAARCARDDELLFGPDLLAAPVLGQGERSRSVYLPRGAWIDLWRSARYDERSGGLVLGRARVLRGGRAVRLPAPLSELPLLARAGALLPLLPPDVDTLAAYGGGRPPGAAGRSPPAPRRARVPARRFGCALRPNGRMRSRELRGRWALSVDAGAARSYRLRAALSTLRRPLRPCRVSLAGRALPRSAWRFSPATAVLDVRFRAAPGAARRRGVLGGRQAARCDRSSSTGSCEQISSTSSPWPRGELAADARGWRGGCGRRPA